MYRTLALVLAAFLGLGGALRAAAAPQENPRATHARPTPPRDYRSRHFGVHTDLPPAEAKALLIRLETTLSFISLYCGRPLRGGIECYVVQDLSNWPANVLPPNSQARIEAGEGIALAGQCPAGQRFPSRWVVYAAAERGRPQHEAVHAYFGQTFGRTGPAWYAEGMAELGKYWRKDDSSVKIEDDVLEYLKNAARKELREIVDPTERAGDSWEDHAWVWALCHLLAYNPNYAGRFRALGVALLSGQPVGFYQVYGAAADQISFEYRMLLDHMDQGYRVDLCAWDWNKVFRPIKSSSRTVAARVIARKGWQPTGLTVTRGHVYSIETSGTWKTEKKAEAVSPDGAGDGKGRLYGVIMREWELGKPFALGAAGVLRAPEDGNLYVRCYEPWNQLADNAGQISLKLKFVTDTAPEGQAVFVPAETAQKTTPKNQPSLPPMLRTWTDATGQYTLEATLVEVRDGNVRLKKKTGEVVIVPLAKLSEEDRRFVEQRQRRP